MKGAENVMSTLSVHLVLLFKFSGMTHQTIRHAHKEERNEVEEEERENVWLHRLSFTRLARLRVVCFCRSIAYAWSRGQVGEAPAKGLK